MGEYIFPAFSLQPESMMLRKHTQGMHGNRTRHSQGDGCAFGSCNTDVMKALQPRAFNDERMPFKDRCKMLAGICSADPAKAGG